MRNAYKILFGKPEGKISLGIPWRRWEDNIKIDFKQIYFKDVDGTCAAQDREQWRALVNTEMNLRFAERARNLTR
jgi:hypothetical protein